MKGDIIEVDYAKTNNLQKSNSGLYIKTFYGYVDNTYRKGGGSANGQNSGNPEPEQAWTPKDKETEKPLKKDIIRIIIRGHKHSNPHDHNIDWNDGHPNFSSPINYAKDNIPEFKSKKILKMYTKNNQILKYQKYNSVNEFKESLIHGREIVIKWNNVEYSIEYENNTMSDFSICEANRPETEVHFKSVDELLNSKLNSDIYLKDIITKAEINWRNI